MEEVFEMKVQEKLQKLKDIEADLARRKETMKKALEQQAQDLQDRKRQFLEDQQLFEREYHEWLEKETQKQANSLNRAGKDPKKQKGKK